MSGHVKPAEHSLNPTFVRGADLCLRFALSSVLLGERLIAPQALAALLDQSRLRSVFEGFTGSHARHPCSHVNKDVGMSVSHKVVRILV